MRPGWRNLCFWNGSIKSIGFNLRRKEIAINYGKHVLFGNLCFSNSCSFGAIAIRCWPQAWHFLKFDDFIISLYKDNRNSKSHSHFKFNNFKVHNVHFKLVSSISAEEISGDGTIYEPKCFYQKLLSWCPITEKSWSITACVFFSKLNGWNEFVSREFQGNPLVCNCSLRWLQLWDMSTIQKCIPEDGEELVSLSQVSLPNCGKSRIFLLHFLQLKNSSSWTREHFNLGNYLCSKITRQLVFASSCPPDKIDFGKVPISVIIPLLVSKADEEENEHFLSLIVDN